jgi:BASS family bile acid:Na+ symporter
MITVLLTKVLLPLSLAIIMLGMGMTLEPADFSRIVKYPKAILIGLCNQLIFLPLIGLFLAIAFDLDPTMAVGLMVITACPGGPTSNLITQVSKGNIALSVTLTAFTSFICILSIPLNFNLRIKLFWNFFGCSNRTPCWRYNSSNYGNHHHSD